MNIVDNKCKAINKILGQVRFAYSNNKSNDYAEY